MTGITSRSIQLGRSSAAYSQIVERSGSMNILERNDIFPLQKGLGSSILLATSRNGAGQAGDSNTGGGSEG